MESGTLPRSLIRELQDIVGEAAVLYEPEELLAFEYDGSVDRGLPQAVVFPTSTEQVSRVVALAHREGIPVVPRGAGTGISGGSVPLRGGIVVALTRMKRILEIDRENRIVLVEPGVTNLALDNAVRACGLRFAPDPSSQRACTVGGNVAENAGGPHCLAYGVTTNHVLGVEVVLEDGSVTWLGGRERDMPGYDLRGVFVGSEGTFGIATQIAFRLLPLPEAVRTLLTVYGDLDSASQTVSAIIAQGIVPATLEMLDQLMIQAVETARHVGYPKGAGAVLLIELEGLREEVEETSRAVLDILEASGVLEVQTAESAEARARLWMGRKEALGSLGSLAPNYLLVDGTVPRSRLARTVKRVQEAAQRYGIPVGNLCHAGDGNLHPCILFDERVPGALKRVVELGGELLKICVEEGGTLSGEHGIGIEKRAYMPLVFSEEDMRVMKAVQRGFGPRGLFNPGKVFPEGAEVTPGS